MNRRVRRAGKKGVMLQVQVDLGVEYHQVFADVSAQGNVAMKGGGGSIKK